MSSEPDVGPVFPNDSWDSQDGPRVPGYSRVETLSDVGSPHSPSRCLSGPEAPSSLPPTGRGPSLPSECPLPVCTGLTRERCLSQKERFRVTTSVVGTGCIFLRAETRSDSPREKTETSLRVGLSSHSVTEENFSTLTTTLGFLSMFK